MSDLTPPGHHNHILLHCCCAPCSGGIITAIQDAGLCQTVLFYNPNIHPEEEYLKRKQTITQFLEKNRIAFIDSDYDPAPWYQATTGLETEPQRGRRCEACFFMRLNYAAALAGKMGIQILTSSFGMSRWKDLEQVNRAGHQAAADHGIVYWDHNWRKKGGQDLASQVIRREAFYRQTYCGCEFSK